MPILSMFSNAVVSLTIVNRLIIRYQCARCAQEQLSSSVLSSAKSWKVLEVSRTSIISTSELMRSSTLRLVVSANCSLNKPVKRFFSPAGSLKYSSGCAFAIPLSRSWRGTICTDSGLESTLSSYRYHKRRSRHSRRKVCAANTSSSPAFGPTLGKRMHLR